MRSSSKQPSKPDLGRMPTTLRTLQLSIQQAAAAEDTDALLRLEMLLLELAWEILGREDGPILAEAMSGTGPRPAKS